MLKKYNIEYDIKKTPVHVFLIADLKGEQIAIETTMPKKGLVVFDDRLKRGYVEYLKANKLISENEFKIKTVDQLFEENYTKATSINIYELAGLQYYNKGVFFNNSSNFTESLKNLEKANLLFTDNSIKFAMSNSLVNVLSDQNNKKKYDGGTLQIFKY